MLYWMIISKLCQRIHPLAETTLSQRLAVGRRRLKYRKGLYNPAYRLKTKHPLSFAAKWVFLNGGRYWVRTSDPLLVRQML